jgi:mRNA interferase YafQ
MQIFRHKNFIKHYKKLNLKNQFLVDQALDILYENPFDPKLRNHQLKGEFKGLSSIYVGSDLRIIFKQEKDYAVIMLLKVGSHNQVY